ncbi:Smr/MutS family protein [Acetobacter sp. AN02]|uniref:Smr/MutS family protein n=1 Tax=Acetobacter sp. AN02 TaxID=2894186 RepID=UPI002434605C|nr:Smr/MutS family protein [Acetobacter sp. AN02]MDG6093805.1 Smr/MutS family protein [Acetobacter sp. AN02]
MARRVTGEGERDLWRLAMRDVRPLHSPVCRPSEASVRPSLQQRETEFLPPSPALQQQERPAATYMIPAREDLSRGETALRRYFQSKAGKSRSQPLEFPVESGALRPERRLDLHGMVAQAAFIRLYGFLVGAHQEGVRCVEIITGLGSGVEGGILRRELPLWLEHPELRRVVHSAAYPHAANRGAVRVRLRRAKRT